MASDRRGLLTSENDPEPFAERTLTATILLAVAGP